MHILSPNNKASFGFLRNRLILYSLTTGLLSCTNHSSTTSAILWRIPPSVLRIQFFHFHHSSMRQTMRPRMTHDIVIVYCCWLDHHQSTPMMCDLCIKFYNFLHRAAETYFIFVFKSSKIVPSTRTCCYFEISNLMASDQSSFAICDCIVCL